MRANLSSPQGVRSVGLRLFDNLITVQSSAVLRPFSAICGAASQAALLVVLWVRIFNSPEPTSHWVRFFKPSEPANFGFVAQNHSTAPSARRVRLCFGPVFSTNPNRPLASFFQAIRTRKLWLRCARPPPSEPRPCGRGLCMGSYFQLNRPEPAIGFVFSNRRTCKFWLRCVISRVPAHLVPQKMPFLRFLAPGRRHLPPGRSLRRLLFPAVSSEPIRLSAAANRPRKASDQVQSRKRGKVRQCFRPLTGRSNSAILSMCDYFGSLECHPFAAIT